MEWLDSALGAVGLDGYADGVMKAVNAIANGDWEQAFTEIGSMVVQAVVTYYTGNPQLGASAAAAFETAANGGDFGDITQASIKSAVMSTVEQYAGSEAATTAGSVFDSAIGSAEKGGDYEQLINELITAKSV